MQLQQEQFVAFGFSWTSAISIAMAHPQLLLRGTAASLPLLYHLLIRLFPSPKTLLVRISVRLLSCHLIFHKVN